MSRLLILTRPELVYGFHLAGVDAHAAADGEAAQAQIERWLASGEKGLLAVDEELFAALPPAFQTRLSASTELPLLLLPDGRPATTAMSGRQRLAELIREAIGFHITFQEHG